MIRKLSFAWTHSSLLAALLASGLLGGFAQGAQAQTSAAGEDNCREAVKGSPFISVDSWVYPAALRLQALGYAERLFIGVRPWTRQSLIRALDDSKSAILGGDGGAAQEEARQIYAKLNEFLRSDREFACGASEGRVQAESTYTVARVLSGTPLRDSFHLGSSIINDYGRPYQNGFNNYSGASGYASWGRFALYARGEFQGAPSATGYSPALTSILAKRDVGVYPVAIDPATGLAYIQSTIPSGPIDTTLQARLLEGYLSAQLLDHVISFGKQDAWYGPGMGAGMAYSNNAENFYAFRINRVEPLTIPLLSKLTGPFRYEMMVGPLKGHIYPRNPWFHAEKVSFKPTRNLEIGFERSAIWGGEGHTPITLHTFLRSFFSTSAPDTKQPYNNPEDPGARFASFDFAYRLPFLRNWVTLYTDSEVHDDISAIDAPRRGSWRPGLYLSHLPGLPKLDLRAEAAYTDPPITNSITGHFMYWERIQQQGYTNNGQLIGDWVGREGKGGQLWLTYHLSGNEHLQLTYRNHKAAKDFIPGGTTLHDVSVDLVKRFRHELEVHGRFTYEQWLAPVYLSGRQTVTHTEIGVTWSPDRKAFF